MSKAACKNCSYFKLVTDQRTKQITRVCFYNAPAVFALPTAQGIAMMTSRPPVEEDDFCHSFTQQPPALQLQS